MYLFVNGFLLGLLVVLSIIAAVRPVDLTIVPRKEFYPSMVQSSGILCLLLVGGTLISGTRLPEIGLTFFVPSGPVWYATIGLIVLLCFVLLLTATVPAFRKRLLPLYQSEAERLILPRTKEERTGFQMVALMAGVTEELIYRGFLFHALGLFLPFSNISFVWIGAILFGVAHRYQGWFAILVTGLIGAGFGYLYLALETLWPLIIIHVLIDLVAVYIYKEDVNS